MEGTAVEIEVIVLPCCLYIHATLDCKSQQLLTHPVQAEMCAAPRTLSLVHLIQATMLVLFPAAA